MLTLPNPQTLILTLTIRTHYRNFRRLESLLMEADSGYRMGGVMGRSGAPQSILSPNLCECFLETFTLQVVIQRETITSHKLGEMLRYPGR